MDTAKSICVQTAVVGQKEAVPTEALKKFTEAYLILKTLITFLQMLGSEVSIPKQTISDPGLKIFNSNKLKFKNANLILFSFCGP
jgi:hypothetical protein